MYRVEDNSFSPKESWYLCIELVAKDIEMYMCIGMVTCICTAAVTMFGLTIPTNIRPKYFMYSKPLVTIAVNLTRLRKM